MGSICVNGLNAEQLLAASPVGSLTQVTDVNQSSKTLPLKNFSQYDEVVKPLLDRMTLAEKVGQMTQTELSSLKSLDEIKELALGSLLSGGNSDPEDGNSLEAWTKTYDQCQRVALQSRLKIPLLYGIDAVHGHNNVVGATMFPHNIGLGCTRNPELIKEISRITALEVRATGIQWNFAPCVASPRDDRWGRTYEGFSENPELVSELGEAAVLGYQGNTLRSPQSVLACAKHFAGDGGTVPERRESHHGGLDAGIEVRWDQGDTQCDEATFRRLHLSTYPASIDAGVGTIMPSYSSWNGVKCTGNHYLLTTILKEEMGFEGFVISDYNAIDQIDPDFKTAIKICINAGLDMAMAPGNYRKYHRLLMELVEEGEVPMTRIDDAVMRILRVKAAMGLLDPGHNQLADYDLHEHFASDAHQAVARQAVRESLVLLKNDRANLPLSRQAGTLHVCGVAADDIGLQCGGWTIDWQGEAGPITTGGATVREAMIQAAGADLKVTYSADGSGAMGADHVVVVVSEPPYAEGVGDQEHPGISAEDQAVIAAAKKAGVPVTLVVFSGRPIELGDALQQVDSVVAAWLPGTRGEGIADVLFGDYAPTGKLSFTWPKSADEHPVNVGDEDYQPLFEYGYGLSY